MKQKTLRLDEPCLVRPMQAAQSRSIASLISKSQKALQKLAAGTWQHTTLRKNLEALRIASDLVTEDDGRSDNFTDDQLKEALRAFASMIDRTAKAQAKFSPGTSHHTLQRDRLEALRMAEARTKAALKGRSKAKRVAAVA